MLGNVFVWLALTRDKHGRTMLEPSLDSCRTRVAKP